LQALTLRKLLEALALVDVLAPASGLGCEGDVSSREDWRWRFAVGG
jgi:hypothetical protein